MLNAASQPLPLRDCDRARAIGDSDNTATDKGPRLSDRPSVRPSGYPFYPRSLRKYPLSSESLA